MDAGDYSTRPSSRNNVPKFHGNILEGNEAPQIISSDHCKEQDFVDHRSKEQELMSHRSREQELIDHVSKTLLAPEYMRDSNTLMMEFIDQQVVFQKSAQSNNDFGTKENALSTELQFPNGIFQFVNKHGQIQCVVSEDGVALEGGSVADTAQAFNNKLPTNFITLNGSFLTDPPSSCSELNADDGHSQFVPLINSSLTAICELTQPNKESVTELGLLADEALNNSNLITETDLINSLSNARKVLPHKKRISKKLKDSEKTLDYPSTSYTEGKEKTGERNIPHQFNCEICDHSTSSQIDFFAHLKQHYEPQPQSSENNHLNTDIGLKSNTNELITQKIFIDSNFLPNKKFEPQEFADVHINFEDFAPVDSVVHVINQRNLNDDMKILNSSNINKCIHLVTQNDVDAPKLVCSEEIEFSDTEDMLEGIRNVVDKVSVEDTCDAVDAMTSNTIRAPWLPNNSFSGISFSNKMIGGSDFPANVNDELLLPKTDEVQFLSSTKPQNIHTDLLHSVNNDDDNDNDNEKKERFSNNNNFYRLPLTQSITTTLALPASIMETKPKPATSSATPTTALLPSSPPTTTTTEIMQLNMQKPLDELLHTKTKNIKRTNKNINTKDIAHIAQPDHVSAEDEEEEEEEEENIDDKLLETEPTKRQFACTHCNRKFNSKNALKYHNRTHTGIRPHQCDICGRSFFAQGALKSHVRTHTGDKPFDCDQCDRKFRQVGDLKYHIISVHNVDKSHQCEFCGKAFSRKYSLVLHRRIHTSERDYKCDFCPKSFRASIYLQSHRKIHTGEKPYQCEDCPKKFRVSGDLRRHTLAHQRRRNKYEKQQQA